MNFLKKTFFSLPQYLFFTSLFLIGCSKEHTKKNSSPGTTPISITLSEEERQWMDKFFNDLLLESPAMYTIFGTKPMSGITIISASEEEWVESTKMYWQNVEEKEKNKVIQSTLEQYRECDLAVNWERWVAWKKNHPESPFLFVKYPTDSKNLFNAYVINAREVVCTMQKYYSLFARELGRDFDPLTETLDFENPDSPFWNAVFKNHLLQGILYGFGEKNAYLFNQEKQLAERQECPSATHPIEEEETSSIETIRLPIFRSYDLPLEKDPVIVKYKKERDLIRTKLKKKNLTIECVNKMVEPTN